MRMPLSKPLTLVLLVIALAFVPTGEGQGGPMEGKVKKYLKPSDEVLRKTLNPLQYEVTQKEGTEPPFRNEYWDNKRPGIYVDAVSGEPLFSSRDKFDSGTGWPSFTRALEPGNLVEKGDWRLFGRRTEVRSRHGDSHLGHLFDDGPKPTELRYCMNSASLRFIPVERLEAEGYGSYLSLFKAPADGGRETAILAGGCFWGVEEIFRKLPGVVETTVGYTGGSLPNPTYKDITTGRTDHAEAIQVVFDPKKVGYEEILNYFFRLHDPTTKNRQGNDAGTQYRSAIFCQNERQSAIAMKVKAQVNQSGKWPREVVTEVVPAGPFYPAEEYHQGYLQKNPGGYTCHTLRN